MYYYIRSLSTPKHPAACFADYGPVVVYILPGPLAWGSSPYFRPRLYKGKAKMFNRLVRSINDGTNCCHVKTRSGFHTLTSKHSAHAGVFESRLCQGIKY